MMVYDALNAGRHSPRLSGWASPRLGLEPWPSGAALVDAARWARRRAGARRTGGARSRGRGLRTVRAARLPRRGSSSRAARCRRADRRDRRARRRRRRALAAVLAARAMALSRSVGASSNLAQIAWRECGGGLPPSARARARRPRARRRPRRGQGRRCSRAVYVPRRRRWRRRDDTRRERRRRPTPTTRSRSRRPPTATTRRRTRAWSATCDTPMPPLPPGRAFPSDRAPACGAGDRRAPARALRARRRARRVGGRVLHRAMLPPEGAAGAAASARSAEPQAAAAAARGGVSERGAGARDGWPPLRAARAPARPATGGAPPSTYLPLAPAPPHRDLLLAVRDVCASDANGSASSGVAARRSPPSTRERALATSRSRPRACRHRAFGFASRRDSTASSAASLVSPVALGGRAGLGQPAQPRAPRGAPPPALERRQSGAMPRIAQPVSMPAAAKATFADLHAP